MLLLPVMWSPQRWGLGKTADAMADGEELLQSSVKASTF